MNNSTLYDILRDIGLGPDLRVWVIELTNDDTAAIVTSGLWYYHDIRKFWYNTVLSFEFNLTEQLIIATMRKTE